jgi:hypothetical protein
VTWSLHHEQTTTAGNPDIISSLIAGPRAGADLPPGPQEDLHTLLNLLPAGTGMTVAIAVEIVDPVNMLVSIKAT